MILVLFIIGCNSDNLRSKFEAISSSTQWAHDTTRYYIEKEYYKEYVSPTDTQNQDHMKTIETYTNYISNKLYVERNLTIQKLSNSKLIEEIIFHKKINDDIESKITLNHNFESKEYTAFFLDTTATADRIRKNNQQADSLIKNVPEGWEICGTALLSVRYEGFPTYRQPVIIDIQKLNSILANWK